MSGTSEQTERTPPCPTGQALLMDAASEPFFDRLLRLAADRLDVPIAFLTLVGADDGEEQLKSSVGLPGARGLPPRLDDAAITASLALPLHGHDEQPIAVFHLADRRRRDWSLAELRLAHAFGELLQDAVRLRRTTLADGAEQLRHRDALARRHRAETDAHRQHAKESAAVEQLSTRLQRALLPARLDADLAARVELLYEPGSERMLLGGDFLDVRRLPDGRIAFVLGDVCGHGPEAAALAVALRASWNTLQDDDLPLETIAERLSRTVAREQPGELLFATALLGVLDPRSGAATALSAGHPMPLAIGARADVVELPLGFPLGLAGGCADPWRAGTVVLGDRSLLVYTDGLTEGRVTPGGFDRLGERGLLAALDHALAAETPPHALGRRLFEYATRGHGAPLPDDVAILHLLAA